MMEFFSGIICMVEQMCQVNWPNFLYGWFKKLFRYVFLCTVGIYEHAKEVNL